MNKEYFISPMLRRGPAKMPRILREFMAEEDRRVEEKIVTDALREEGINLPPEKVEKIVSDTDIQITPNQPQK